jgi:RNA polymerase sigma-70 factor (ECF subfamily)
LQDASDNEGRWSQMMAAAQDGDRTAYECLLREIVPYIRIIVYRRHRAEDQVEEAVQDVLLTIHRVRQTYDPARPIKPWISAIAQRRAIDLLRRRGRRAALEVSDEAAYETFPDPQANRASETYAMREELSEAIARLPEQQREALELLKLKEMSLLEASKASGRSVAALKVNVHRAIKTLRSRLAGD